MIENQAKLQAMDRKGSSMNNALAIPTKMVEREKMPDQAVQLPSMPPIDIYKYSGAE